MEELVLQQPPPQEEEEGVEVIPVLYSYPKPSGYRFDPTDDELFVYLLSNMDSGRMGLRYDPSIIIPTVDVYGPSSEPWRLCELVAFPYALTPTEFFCFTTRNQLHSRGDRCHRTAGIGTWYANGKEKEIWDGGVLVGRSSFFSFKVPPRGVTGTVDKNHMVGTHWVMYEYRLESGTQFQNTVICRIRNHKKEEQISKGQWKTPWWEEICPFNVENDDSSGNVTRKRTMLPSPPTSSSGGTGETLLASQKRPPVISGGDPSCGSTMQPPEGDLFHMFTFDQLLGIVDGGTTDDPFFPPQTMFTFDELMGTDDGGTTDDPLFPPQTMFSFDELMGTDDGGSTGERGGKGGG